ncbi:unnamed protein product [Gordionus sp. m RMFG-2023]
MLLARVLARFIRFYHNSLQDYNVYISKSHDIYTNLALEDYIYSNTNNRILLIYINKPCVVIGRFQNPWNELNIQKLLGDDINICRRKSGGGTVYHDKGNVNFSFFTYKHEYNRKVNLSLIQVPLNDALNINIQINNKDDLIYLNKKISGSAAKIGSKLCYHHCTLLVNSDLNLINDYLTSQLFPFHIECKATKSVRSKVENLININPTVDQDTIIKYIAKSYLSFYKNTENNIFEIEPNEKNFPGIYKAIQEFKSWEWLYGKTPKFSLSLIFDNDIIPLLNRFNMSIQLPILLALILPHIILCT